ncbi:MAG: dephospho-CoA kinase [Candidatus Electronema aureum]|uniref:Dephospho-CoA kinase n=1 Tax=Candidatus Electronema aureum TaxID=2005002 RepID=A0A521G4P1_9BACT|nr:MAG: dephospho-CoA kinase [Candidatus Electronema aureum]
MPELIGITGGIGSGKSRACRFLADLGGWPLLDLDQICRALLLPQAQGWLALKKLLPADFFTANGELNRSKLREAIFADAGLRRQIDSLLHPLAKQEMTAQAARLNAPLVLAEIPLLFEAGWQDSVSQIVVVYADEAVRLRRIMERDQVSEEQARRAIAAQMPLEDKARLADHLIDNSAAWESTCGQLRHVAKKIYITTRS